MASYDVPPRHPSGRLPFSYQRLPGPIRFWISRWLIGGAPLSDLDLSIAFREDVPGDAAQISWPGEAPVAMGLSHDVDTALGVAQVDPLLDVEEARGVRSTIFIPGDLARAHASEVRRWIERGWEVGLHGARHDNRLASLDGAALQGRIDEIHEVAREFGMRGFRAPSFWVREAQLLRLGPPLRYDSSVPSHRPATRIAPERGSYSCRPFPIGALLELPVGMPLDDDLLREGRTHEEFLPVLSRYLEAIARLGGVAVFADHAEPHLSGHARARAAYGQTLDRLLGDGRTWCAPLIEIVDRLEAGS